MGNRTFLGRGGWSCLSFHRRFSFSFLPSSFVRLSCFLSFFPPLFLLALLFPSVSFVSFRLVSAFLLFHFLPFSQSFYFLSSSFPFLFLLFTCLFSPLFFLCSFCLIVFFFLFSILMSITLPPSLSSFSNLFCFSCRSILNSLLSF